MLRGLAAVLLALPSIAWADIALVDLVSGDVTYGAKKAKVTAYMKVREGDRFNVARGGQVRVMYFKSARQEHYAGPASFTAGPEAGKLHSGAKPRVTEVPRAAAGRLARIPELMENAKLGGVTLRGKPPTPLPEDQALREARAAYERMRSQVSQDDATPELFLFAALADYNRYDEMSRLADEALRKQPGNEDMKALAAWVRTQRERVK